MLLSTVWAGPQTTRDALERLGEVLELRQEEGQISAEYVMPTILVSTRPRYEESGDWYPTQALGVVTTAFRGGSVRMCEACMAPRAWVEDGNMIYQTGPIALDEVRRLDDQHRGKAPPAKTAIWLDEISTGVAIKIIDLATSEVVFSQNVDPDLYEDKRSKRYASLTSELERRARGDGLTQLFVDAVLYPRQHLSLDWTDQWGKRNFNFTGVTFSFVDPVGGLGMTYARRLPLLNSLVGAKVSLSLPTAVSRAVVPSDGEPIDIFDPLLTGVLFVRVPIGRSNYGLIASGSTNGNIGIGVSLMNFSFLPFIL